VVGRRDARRDIQFQPIDLAGAVLAGAVLARARLTHARLDGANLTGANLYSAHLDGAVLYGAHLDGANLYFVYLTRAHLDGADLTRADLTRADLTGADLTGADITGADITEADLTEVRWPEGVQVPEGWTVDSNSSRLKRADGLSEVGSGAGAVALSGVRSRSHFSPGFPCGPLHCVTMAGCSVSSPRRIEPCVRFSRTRLTDAVHRRHSA
jgi:hypothetical protein